MYHRIAEPSSDVWDIAVSTANFEAHLQWLKKLGKVMPLPELISGAKSGKLRHGSIAITFDDGYADNFLVAKPLLEQYSLPATFFVATGNIGKAKEFWWDELEELILYGTLLPALADFNFCGQTIKRGLGEEARLHDGLVQKHQLWNACLETPVTERCMLFLELWQAIKPLPVASQLQCMQEIRTWAGASASARADIISMSVSQLSALAQNPRFEIGAHTVSHPALAYHSMEVQKQEISQNIAELRTYTGREIQLLAYPYGNYNYQTERVAEEIGLFAALTTEEHAISKRSPVYRLGRFQVADWPQEVFAGKLKQWSH